MAQGRVLEFTDPYSFQSAIRGGNYDVVVKSKGDFRVELTTIDLDRLWMQRSSGGLPWVIRCVNVPTRSPVVFLAEEDKDPMQYNGIEITSRDLVVCRNPQHQLAPGASNIAALSLTHEDLAAASLAVNGRPLELPPDTYALQPSAAALARLRRLHGEARRLAKTAPDLIRNQQAAAALEDELVRAMIECLTQGMSPSREAPLHSKVMSRFEEFVAERPHEPLHLAEVCRGIGVSVRTLRACCQEYLGVGPNRYLWLRRMKLARAALLDIDSATKTVTDVATNYGFWELGRFAVEYRDLYGETPSNTLRRARVLETRGPTMKKLASYRRQDRGRRP
jgi:AraC-like DNA-binding protein